MLLQELIDNLSRLRSFGMNTYTTMADGKIIIVFNKVHKRFIFEARNLEKEIDIYTAIDIIKVIKAEMELSGKEIDPLEVILDYAYMEYYPYGEPD